MKTKIPHCRNIKKTIENKQKSQKEAKSIPLIHKFMTARFPD